MASTYVQVSPVRVPKIQLLETSDIKIHASLARGGEPGGQRVLLGTPVKTTTNRREALSGDKLFRDMKPSRYVTPRRPAQKPS